jgi:hypothetical protein
MRPLWLPLLLATLLWGAKDNFIFDLSTDEETLDRIERIESVQQAQQDRLDQLNTQGNLHTATLQSTKAAIDRLQKSQRQIAERLEALSRGLGGASEHGTKGANGSPQSQNREDLQAQIDTLSMQIERLEPHQSGTDEAAPIATMKQQLSQLSDRIALLEKRPATAQQQRDQPTGGLIPLEPFYIDSFVFLTVGLMVMLFLILMAALSRTKEAEKRIARLAELYQSSSKKIEERK